MGVARTGVGRTGVDHGVGSTVAAALPIETEAIRPLGATDYDEARRPGTHLRGSIGAAPLHR